MLAIISLWRAHTPFFLSNPNEEQDEEWSNGAVKVWDSPLNIAVKISFATTSMHEAKMAFLMKSQVLESGGVKWLRFALWVYS